MNEIGIRLQELLVAAGWTDQKVRSLPATGQLSQTPSKVENQKPLVKPSQVRVNIKKEFKPLRISKGGHLIVSGGRISRSAFSRYGVGRRDS